jgi:dsDNA-specific endonuclease/ATPase MutS2
VARLGENIMTALEILRDWAYNEGEFEELVSKLANGNGFESISVSYEKEPEVIRYEYRLSNIGKQIACDWAQKNGFSPIEDTGEFDDEDKSSIEKTLEMLGTPKFEDNERKQW